MSDKVESLVENNMAIGETICRTGKSVVDGSAPSGPLVNLAADLASRDACGDIEQLERKRKTRRRKTKRKNPYNKTLNVRGKKPLKPRGVSQPVAPYNSNQFLIEDHNDLQDFDVKLMAVSAANRAENQNGAETQRTGRQRDPSFTSAESDQEFYSSPEDEEEFLTREFSNTYQDLHVESLSAMSKTDLIQTVLQLEEKIDSLEKRLGSKGTTISISDDSDKDLTPKEKEDKEKFFQSEICKLVRANEVLINENEKLRQATSKLSSGSSEDSESDSSTSSDSSDMSQSDGEDTSHYEHMNGEMECEPDTNMESANVT